MHVWIFLSIYLSIYLPNYLIYVSIHVLHYRHGFIKCSHFENLQLPDLGREKKGGSRSCIGPGVERTGRKDVGLHGAACVFHRLVQDE